MVIRCDQQWCQTVGGTLENFSLASKGSQKLSFGHFEAEEAV